MRGSVASVLEVFLRCRVYQVRFQIWLTQRIQSFVYYLIQNENYWSKNPCQKSNKTKQIQILSLKCVQCTSVLSGASNSCTESYDILDVAQERSQWRMLWRFGIGCLLYSISLWVWHLTSQSWSFLLFMMVVVTALDSCLCRNHSTQIPASLNLHGNGRFIGTL